MLQVHFVSSIKKMPTPIHSALSANLDSADIAPILEAIFDHFKPAQREVSMESLKAEMTGLEHEETRIWNLKFIRAGQVHTVRIEIFMDDLNAPDVDIDTTDPDLSGVLDQLLLRLHPDDAE